MKIVETSAAVVLEPAAAATAAVIWLHGLGADGHDFVPIVPELGLAPTLSVRFIFPHAAQRPVTLNGGMRMRAWFDLLGLNRTDAQDEAGIRASALQIDALIEAQVTAGVARERIVIAGFSQGGALALHAGLRQQERVAGLMILSGYLPLEKTLTAELTPAGRATPVLMCHGRQDPVLSLTMGTHSRDLLQALGVAVEWHDYPMAHEVSRPEIHDISVWLAARLR
jgi:phospholipase/carboxylesterase